MIERRPALGKGLSALIPDAPEPPRSGADRSRHRSARAERAAAARAAWTTRSSRSWRSRSRRTASFSRSSCAAPATPIASSPANGAGARRSAPACSRCRSSSATWPRVDKQLLELALIENIQRENLNPIDEALAYQRLADEFALTQDQIAAAVGKDRSSVANFMRLLKLPEEVRADLASGALSMGHARALLALPDAAAQRHGAREVDLARPVGPRHRSAGQEARRRQAAAAAASPRRSASRPMSTRARPRTGCASPWARKSASSGAGTGGRNRDRFRLGRRAEPDLRAAHRAAADARSSAKPHRACKSPSFRGIKRRLCLSGTSSSVMPSLHDP